MEREQGAGEMKYKCTAYKTDEQGRIYAYCGASQLVDGVLYCTHEHGAYCPDYSTERCGFAEAVNEEAERQIKIG